MHIIRVELNDCPIPDHSLGSVVCTALSVCRYTSLKMKVACQVNQARNEKESKVISRELEITDRQFDPVEGESFFKSTTKGMSRKGKERKRERVVRGRAGCLLSKVNLGRGHGYIIPIA